MPKEMLINVSEGEECRIALVEDGKLEELYMERSSSTSHVGNIYKGRITNVEASIQAAFVDFGLGRNGFLHISDLMPTYFGRKGEDIQESVGRKMARRDRPPIQRCLRRGDEIIVQIIKEGIGTKGPTLSSYLSIPGRILVMMPGMANKGVSKKIEDDEERRRLRQILDGLQPPKDVGFIIRTAGIGKTKAEIQRDFVYLTRLWQMIEKQLESGPGPMELYTEGDLVSRTVRDVYSPDIETIVVDNEDVAKRVRDVIKLANPRAKDKVEFYDGPIPLFHKYDIEKDIELMHSRHVPLPGGGSLVIDSTEAVVAIDINSGKFRDHSDAETTAFKTDMEAAEEIPRQLRLRDLGGVIICDFIDLRFERHRRELEEKLHEKFKNDRAKTKVLRMSDFGIIEMTRQRMRPSLKRSIYSDCPHCKGAGLVKTPESMSLDVMRRLTIAAHDERVVRVELAVNPVAGYYLQNRKRAALANLEYETNKPVMVRTDQSLALDEAKLELYDSRDGKVYLPELGMIPEAGAPPAGRPAHAGKPTVARASRNDPRGDRRPQANQGRRREAEPLEEKFDLDRGEEAVDEREETREEESTHVPLTVKPNTPAQPRRDERPESYSNFTDNDVDLGDDEEQETERPRPHQNRDSQGANRNEPRRDQRNDQRQDNRRDHRPDLRNNQRNDQRNNQQSDPRNSSQGEQQADQRNDQRNDSRRDGGGQQRPDPRPDQRPDQRQESSNDSRRPAQGQPQRPPQNQPVRPGQNQPQRPPQNQPVRQNQNQPQRPPQQPPQGEPQREGEAVNEQDVQEEGGDGQRRRRRRRGGRGRGRNRNRDGMNPNETSDQQDGQQAMFPTEGREGGFEGREEGSSSDARAPFEPSQEESRVESVEETRRPERDEVVESREPVVPEIVVEVPAIEPEEKAKPVKGGRKRKSAAAPAAVAAKPKGRAKKATAANAEKAAPVPKAPRRSARAEKVEKIETLIPESTVVTGSSDRHQLILEESDEEPLVPSPGRRPRTYRDLDEIPDDLD